MADNKKIYSIQINGIDQSIKQVDALSDALQFLDKKIKELESRSVSITSSNSGGSSRNADLQTEDKLLKQIQSTEQQIRDARREDYASLLAQKDILKDIVDETKQRAAQERLSVGNYGNTMKGLKQELSDIKSVMQTTDLGSDKFNDLTKRASELTNKLKELEQEYGQFGRNVGNYKSAFDGFDKINVNIGGVVKEFDNLKQAAKAIKDAMGALEYNGNKDTEMYKQLEAELDKVTKAQLRLNSAMNDAKSSSKAMDDLLDTLQSFGAMGQVTQGFSALFGIDNTEIERSIQKLVALQNVMQGIEKIRQQMNTQEGIGKIFAKGFDQIDAMNFKLKRVIVSINGTGTAAKAAAVGVNVLTTAAKALASIGIVAIISAAAYAIEKLVSWMSDWAKGNAELVSSEKMLKVAIDNVNSSLDKNIKLTQAKYDAGRITYQEKLIEEEKAYADALKASNAELKKRIELDSKNPDTKNNTFTQYASGKKNNADIYNDKGVTIFGGFTEAIKTDDELIKRYEALNEAVNKNTGLVYKNAKGYEIAHLSLDDCKDELNHLEQMLSGRMVNAMQQFDVSTKEGRKGLENFVTQILNSNSTLYKSLLLRLPEIVQENASGLKDGLSNWLTIVQQFVQNANAEMKKLDAEKWANSIIESADKTGKKLFQRQKEQADAMLEEGLLSKEKHDEVIAAINKNEKDKMKTFLDGEKRTADERRKKIEAAEKELISLRISLMEEGLDKQLAQIEEERRQKLEKIKSDGVKVGKLTTETNKVYDKKVEDAKKEHAKEVEKIYTDMWRDISNINYENSEKEFEIQKSRLENEYEELKEIAARNSGTANQSLSDRSTIITKKPKSKSKEGSTDTNDYSYDVLIEKEAAYTLRLMEEFKKRTQDREKYYAEIQKLSIEEENKRYELETANAKTNYENEKRLLDQSYQDRELQYKDYRQRGIITQAEYDEISKNLEAAKESQLNTLQNTYQMNSEKMLKEHNQRMANTQNQSNEAFVQNVQELLGQLSNIDFSQLSEKEMDAILANLDNLDKQIKSRIAELENELKRKDLTKEQREQIETLIEELKKLETQVGETALNIDSATDEKFERLINKINNYAQTLGQTLQTVLQALWDGQDAAYEKELEILDETLEATKEKYNEMDALAEEHKSNMESLEDKIKDAQGSARDALIERYNAEKLAQREALAEKKKIEKEEEKLQAKKEKMELEQKKRQKKRDLVTAAINTAMAISMAAVNTWPMPAIAMMAAAAVAGAAQIAAIASQNYAHGGQLDGGVAQGNRHRDGGIKVLGGHAEIEGGEFVTNRLTTSKNIDLLEYINSKKKRININDLIEFYGGDSPVKKNIQNVRTRFAEGGVIPTLATVDTNDRLLTVIEDYSNRPVQVAVVDIIDRTQQVNDVRVMAGLDV